jgi:4-hydroxy-tetrahydrodipicolinate synthase
MSFTGTFTALATPFFEGKLDVCSFEKLVETQLAARIDGIVPAGTTGESPTLSYREHAEVIRLAVQFARGKCQVIAGTGSNCTREAIELTQEAERLGASGVLLVAPYYNKPTQEGLVAHYSAIAKATGLPIVLYSIPGRCGIEIAVETVVRLVEMCPNICCIKEAGGSVERVSALRQALGEEITILSGDDSLTLPFMSVGARGVISVASNLIPDAVREMVSAALGNDFAKAAQLHEKYYPLFKDLFIETNPVPVKYALARSGVFRTDEVRLPLVPLAAASRSRLDQSLSKLNL